MIDLNISYEVQCIMAFMASTGVPFKVTDINTPNIHLKSSYHYRPGTKGTGLAMDLAFISPTNNSPELLQIWAAFRPVEKQLAELLYRGAPYNIKNGKRIPPTDKYNHVHVAVEKGTFLVPLEEPMTDDPNLPNITGPIKFEFMQDPNTGVCIGYYQYSESTGEIHGHGVGAPYHNRSEIIK